MTGKDEQVEWACLVWCSLFCFAKSGFVFFVTFYSKRTAQFLFRAFQKICNIKPIDSEVCLVKMHILSTLMKTDFTADVFMENVSDVLWGYFWNNL